MISIKDHLLIRTSDSPDALSHSYSQAGDTIRAMGIYAAAIASAMIIGSAVESLFTGLMPLSPQTIEKGIRNQ